MQISKKGTGRCKQFFVWLLTGKKLLLSDDIMLVCPRCNTKMNTIEKHNVTIDVCPFCNGLWLDHGEIDQLNQIANKNIKSKTKKTSTRKKVKKLVVKKVKTNKI